jgi:hypothetical protein
MRTRINVRYSSQRGHCGARLRRPLRTNSDIVAGVRYIVNQDFIDLFGEQGSVLVSYL